MKYLIFLLLLSGCGSIGYRIEQSDGDKTGHYLYWNVYEKEINVLDKMKDKRLDRIEKKLDELLKAKNNG